MPKQDLVEQHSQLNYPAEPTRVIRVRCLRKKGLPGKLPAIVVVHGFKGFFNWGFFPEWQERLARAGWLAVALNLSGCGVGADLEHFSDDQGFFDSTPSRDLEDLECVLLALSSGQLPGADTRRLGLFGHSRGGGSALLHAASTQAYRAVVTWASVASSNRFDGASIERWRLAGALEVPNARTGKLHRLGLGWLQDAERNAAALDILQACARLETPTLLIHGDADLAVPASDLQQLAHAFQPGVASSRLILGAGHAFGAVHPWRGTSSELEQAMAASLDFLSTHLGS